MKDNITLTILVVVLAAMVIVAGLTFEYNLWSRLQSQDADLRELRQQILSNLDHLETKLDDRSIVPGPSTLYGSTTKADPPTGVLAKWVQLVPGKVVPTAPASQVAFPAAALVRLVTAKGSSCPALRVNHPEGVPITTTERYNPHPWRFPVVVCEVKLPTGGLTSRLYFPDGSSLRIPTLTIPNGGITRFVFIGDTGCRGSSGKVKNRQHCYEGTTEPLSSMADPWLLRSLAEHAATFADKGDDDPFVVVHVGDYVYRSTETWQVWRDDFFRPSAPLLEAAPWIFVRGNHESCTFPQPNSAEGWFLFFSVDDSLTYRCPDPTTPRFMAPFALDVAHNLRLVVADSADAFNFSSTKGKESFKFDAFIDGTPVWLITHVPLLGIAGETELSSEKKVQGFQAGFKDETSKVRTLFDTDKSVKAIFSGDLHYFQLVQKQSSEQPVQFVVGNGGVKRDKLPSPAIHLQEQMENETIEPNARGLQWTTIGEFGFVLACRQRHDDQWVLLLLTSDNRGVWRVNRGGETKWLPCKLDENQRICAPMDWSAGEEEEFRKACFETE